MKTNKNILIVVGVLVVGALAVTLFDNRGSKPSDEKLGTNLIEANDIINLKKITIASTHDKVELERVVDASWVISSSDSFPVDITRVTSLLDNLEKVKFQRLASKTDKNFEKFGLKNPTTLTLEIPDNNKTIKLGENRSGGGQYIALGAETKAYLVDPSVNANTDASFWELKTLANIEPDFVKTISFRVQGYNKALTATREKKEDNLKLSKEIKGKKVKEYQVTNLKGVLQNINFTKRYDMSNELANTALAKGKLAKVELFDGRKFEIKVGYVGKDEKERKYFVEIKKTAPGKDVSKDDGEADNLMTKIFTLARYEVGAATYSKVYKKSDDFFEKKVSQKKKADKKG